jgi:GTP pyrophosphokinase
MLLAMARDVRVILIKLADRLHNMRTLDACRRRSRSASRARRSTSTRPIANRLGLISLYYELEDLGFHYLHPTRFKVLEKALKKARGNRRDAGRQDPGAIQNRLRSSRSRRR